MKPQSIILENIAMPAARAGNGFKLSGAKTFVIDGHVANLLIVAARTAGKAGDTNGLTLFLVDANAPGVRAERTATVDTHNAARITFEDVNVSADNVLGKVDAGWDVLEGVLNVGRAAVAAEMVGASEEAFGRTVAYLKERKQFGKAIGEFQALQHRAAHLYCELEVTRAAVLKALQTLDDSFDRAGAIVSVAKARAGLSATLAVQEARADAWRHRDDRRIRHRLVHEASPRMPGTVRRLELPRRSAGAPQPLLKFRTQFLAGGAPMSDRDSVTVAIVGAGEMGAAVGRRLREAGARVVTSLAGRSAESVARVRDAGLEVVNDDDSLRARRELRTFDRSAGRRGRSRRASSRSARPRAKLSRSLSNAMRSLPRPAAAFTRPARRQRPLSTPALSADRRSPALRIPQRVRAFTHQAATLIC